MQVVVVVSGFWTEGMELKRPKVLRAFPSQIYVVIPTTRAWLIDWSRVVLLVTLKPYSEAAKKLRMVSAGLKKPKKAACR